MNHRHITDAGVAGLPLHEGRAELLEEIMSTAQSETVSEPARRPSRRWTPAIAAAAAVAVIATGAVWLTQRTQPEVVPVEVPMAAAPGNGALAVLTAAGWTLDVVSIDEDGGELTYVNESLEQDPGNPSGASFDITWYSADQYARNVEDREDIGPSEDIEVLGVPARMWAYDPQEDHTAIREVVGDFMLEVRGSGVDRAMYLALLDQLQGIEPSELDAWLPDEFVTDDERDAVVAEMLEPIPVPEGFDSTIESEEADRYFLGADVTRAVTCAWIDAYSTARSAEDDAGMRAAADAMATSRDWPILNEMMKRGEWPTSIWSIADDMAEGGALDMEPYGDLCLEGEPEQ